jgi:hypothetical protein
VLGTASTAKKRRKNYFALAGPLREKIISGFMPEVIIEQFQQMLDYFGQSPSSSVPAVSWRMDLAMHLPVSMKVYSVSTRAIPSTAINNLKKP